MLQKLINSTLGDTADALVYTISTMSAVDIDKLLGAIVGKILGNKEITKKLFDTIAHTLNDNEKFNEMLLKTFKKEQKKVSIHSDE